MCIENLSYRSPLATRGAKACFPQSRSSNKKKFRDWKTTLDQAHLVQLNIYLVVAAPNLRCISGLLLQLRQLVLRFIHIGEIMVGAKQKKVSARTANDAPRVDLNDAGMRYYSSGDDSEDDDVAQKDETEERLEKLLFGDDDGFRSALKSHGEQRSTDLVMLSDKEDGDEEEEDVEENMDDMADADVGLSSLYACVWLSCFQLKFSRSFFS
jgi:hypothetical protein